MKKCMFVLLMVLLTFCLSSSLHAEVLIDPSPGASGDIQGNGLLVADHAALPADGTWNRIGAAGSDAKAFTENRSDAFSNQIGTATLAINANGSGIWNNTGIDIATINTGFELNLSLLVGLRDASFAPCDTQYEIGVIDSGVFTVLVTGHFEDTNSADGVLNETPKITYTITGSETGQLTVHLRHYASSGRTYCDGVNLTLDAPPLWLAHDPNPEDGNTMVDPVAATELSWLIGEDPNNPGVPNPDIKGHWLKRFAIYDGEPNLLTYTATLVTDLADPITWPISLGYSEEVYWQVDEALDDGSGNPRGITDANNLEGYLWYFKTKPAYAPVAQPEGLLLDTGGTAVFEFVFTQDSAPVSVTWLKDGEDLPGDADYVVTPPAAEPNDTYRSTLTISNVEAADEAYYSCLVDGSNESDEARLMVKKWVLYWPFEFAGYGSGVDLTGNGYDAAFYEFAQTGNEPNEILADPNFAPGISGLALNVDERQTLAKYVFPEQESWIQWTISVWAQTTRPNQTNYNSVFSAAPSCQIDVNGNGSWRFHPPATPLGPIVTPPVLGDPNVLTWAHLAAANDGQTIRLYYNGVPVDTIDPAGAEYLDFAEFVVGRNRGGDLFFRGLIDELKIWNYARTDTDIAQEYFNLTAIRPCSYPPVWDLDGDCRVGLTDLSEFVNDWLLDGLCPGQACP